MKMHRSRGGRNAVAWMLLVSLLIVGASVAAGAAGPSYVPNEYIVKAAPGSTVRSVDLTVGQMGGVVVRPLPLADMYHIRLGAGTPKGGSLRKRAANYVPRAQVMSYAPNYIKHAAVTPTAIPNDQLFPQQWALGSINMPQAWAIQKGSASVRVAVLDSGVANHPELAGRLVPGTDFVDNDADPSNDDFGHGTRVAGVIAAQGDNLQGICGVCWNGVNIMPIRVLDASGDGTTARIVQGMYWAKTNGAPIVNMSFSGDAGVADLVEQAAVTDLATSNIIMVGSVGNDGLNIPTSVGSPALCPEVIAAGAVGPNDEIAPYSSYGPGNEVDISAPGGLQGSGESSQILTLYAEPGPVWLYDYINDFGTSYAAAAVSGAAALLLSAGVPPADVRTQLETSARSPKGLGTIDKRKYGVGILDVASALSTGSVLITKPVKGSTVTENPDFRINVRGIDPYSLAVYVDYGDGNNDDLPDDLGAEVPVLSGGDAVGYLNSTQTAFSFNWSDVSSAPLAPGFHLVYVKAMTTTGSVEVFDWGTFTVSSRVIPAGTYLISLPYDATLSEFDGLRHPLPQELLWDASTSQPLDFRPSAPGRSRLIRWSAADFSYLEYMPGSDGYPAPNDRSWVNLLSPTYSVATGGGFLPSDPLTLTFPSGSGFWLILQKDAVLSNAYPVINAPSGFSIPLLKGWNLIGNPFTHEIARESILLMYQGKIRTLDDDSRLPVYSQWVQPILYGYSTENIPGYDPVETRGVLEPFKGYWIRSRVGGMSSTDQLVMFVQ